MAASFDARSEILDRARAAISVPALEPVDTIYDLLDLVRGSRSNPSPDADRAVR